MILQSKLCWWMMMMPSNNWGRDGAAAPMCRILAGVYAAHLPLVCFEVKAQFFRNKNDPSWWVQRGETHRGEKKTFYLVTAQWIMEKNLAMVNALLSKDLGNSNPKLTKPNHKGMRPMIKGLKWNSIWDGPVWKASWKLKPATENIYIYIFFKFGQTFDKNNF